MTIDSILADRRRKTMTKGAIRMLAASASLAALTCATPALAAKQPSNAELLKLVRAQAAQIDALQKRLDTVEAKEGEQAQAVAAASAAQTQQAQTNAQVAAAAADARNQDVAALQAQVAQLSAHSKHDVKVSFHDGGPTFSSQDGHFTFHPKGRIVADFSSTSGSSYGARNIAGTEFRDLRLGAEGSIGKVGYNLDVDVAGNAVSVKEAYISYTTRLFGLGSKTYVGNSLNDRSIEGATELVGLPFNERNAVANVAVPQVGYFGLGLQERLFGKGWHVSFAVKGDDIGDNDGTHNDNIAYFTRAHINPVLGDRGFIHLGAWGYYESLYGPTSINKTSGVATDFNGQVRVSASSIANVKSDRGYGFEGGAGWHSLWAFGEYGTRRLQVPGGPDVDQKAWTAYGGFFLTGEKPGYSSHSGILARPKVLRPLGSGGAGAFELLGRYDKYDFTDAARGGEGDAITLGANWYLNNFVDFKFNYIFWKTQNQVGSFKGDDTGNTLQLRGEITF
jgi:phosphate-selective porin OprO/OprP